MILSKLKGSLAALFSLLLALSLGLVLATPGGQARAEDPVPITAPAEQTVVEGEMGRVMLSIINPATTYKAGDVVSLQYRYESKIEQPSDVVVSSTTVQGASKCKWGNLPPVSSGGKYNCNPNPRPSHTITADEAAAGRATITTSWQVTNRTTNAVETITHSKAIAVRAGAAPSPSASPSAAPLLSVKLTRTDALGKSVQVGQTVTYKLTYTNLSGAALTAFPATSNLAGVLTSGVPNCRWANLAAGDTKECSTANHTVTEDDLAAGRFTPRTTWKATADRDGVTVLQDNIVAEAAPFTVVAASGELVEGVGRLLATGDSFGFTCHRIPALTQATNGWILASWDGRPGNCGDAPNPNSILQRISKDGGKTWLPATVIAAGQKGSQKYGYSDPSYVVDRETGKIFSFFVKSYDQGWGGSQAGTDPNQRNVLHAAVIESSDHGTTWSQPKVITADITPQASWTSRFAASGEGIQLRYGTHKGRLLQQYTIRDAGVMKAVTVYSDDHGATWTAGSPVGTGMDENKVVELSNGDVMLNSRTSDGISARKVAISTDGGQTYGPVRVDSALVDPRNNASIIRAYPDAPMGSAKAKMLLFSNANDPGSRVNGTVRLSLDDGRTWSAAKVFQPGQMSYSTLTPLAEPGTYGLFYEGAHPTMYYTQVSLDWLDALMVSMGGENQVVHRGESSLTFTVKNLGQSAIAGAVFTPTLPQGWTLTAPSAAIVATPFSLAAGAERTITVGVVVPGTADPAVHTVSATLSAGEKTATGGLQATLELLPGQHAAAPVAATPATTLPFQPGDDPGNMFDGDPATIWHSPWYSTVALPLDVDLSLGDEPLDLSSLSVLPRQAGGTNGRINGYEVYVGDDATSLTKVAGGSMPNSSADQRIDLVGQKGRFLRLRILSTYGEPANKFASIAELAVFRLVPDDVATPSASPSTTVEPTASQTPATAPSQTHSPTPAPTQAPTAGGGPQVHVSTTRVAVGEPITITARNVAPTSTVRFELHSDPILLGTVTADAGGTATLTTVLPKVSAGRHTIVVIGPDGARASISITVTAAPHQPGLPNTGGAPLAGTLVGVLALVAGAAVFVGRRRAA